MELLINIVLFCILGLAFWQDKKGRSIHLAVLLALAAACFTLFAFNSGEFSFSNWRIITINAAFVVVIILCLILYVSAKEQRLVNIFKTHFGLGDLVFLLAVTPLFSNRNFILFFITGIVFSGVLHWMVQRRGSGETIPLAGYLSLYLIALKSIDLITNSDLFYTDLI